MRKVNDFITTTLGTARGGAARRDPRFTNAVDWAGTVKITIHLKGPDAGPAAGQAYRKHIRIYNVAQLNQRRATAPLPTEPTGPILIRRYRVD